MNMHIILKNWKKLGIYKFNWLFTLRRCRNISSTIGKKNYWERELPSKTYWTKFIEE